MTSNNSLKNHYKQQPKLALVHICNCLKRLQGQLKVLILMYSCAAIRISTLLKISNKFKELRSNYTVICSNSILSEMCVRYLTYCKPDECVNMKLVVVYLCQFYLFSVYTYNLLYICIELVLSTLATQLFVYLFIHSFIYIYIYIYIYK